MRGRLALWLRAQWEAGVLQTRADISMFVLNAVLVTITLATAAYLMATAILANFGLLPSPFASSLGFDTPTTVLVAASDSQGTLADASGLDVAALAALKAAGRPLSDHPAGRRAARDAIIDIACEIWIPAARPDVIDGSNVGRLDTRILAQGANIPCTEEAETALHARGVLVLPDFIANAGGVICAAVEHRGGSEADALATTVAKIRDNTAAVLDEARRAGTMPRRAAVALAERRVRAAMALRRFR